MMPIHYVPYTQRDKCSLFGERVRRKEIGLRKTVHAVVNSRLNPIYLVAYARGCLQMAPHKQSQACPDKVCLVAGPYCCVVYQVLPGTFIL